jgi:hypothetical protein
MLTMPRRFLLVGLVGTLAGAPQFLAGQTGAAVQTPQPAPLPPATKLEAFKPAAGSIVTLGYNDLGQTSGVAVDARELRDVSGTTVRGLLVDVTESQYREERSFVDADEIPELLKGIDALLAVKVNPTSFDKFEVRYTTKGALELTAFNSGRDIKYAIQAGGRCMQRDSWTKVICKSSGHSSYQQKKSCPHRNSDIDLLLAIDNYTVHYPRLSLVRSESLSCLFLQGDQEPVAEACC